MGAERREAMRDRRTWTVLLTGLAWISLSSGGALPMGAAGSAADAVSAHAPWTPEVPGIETAFRALGTPLSRADLGRVARTVAAEARRAGFSPDFVLAVIQIESGGDPFAISPKGAVGLMQLLPDTGRAVAEEVGLRWEGPETLFDPVANVQLGVAYLERLRARYGNLSIALTAYNWGPTRVSDMLRRSEPIPVGYSRRVLAACRERGDGNERPI
jgi:soluble lytic murein transglycosylase-like protein